MATGSPLFEHCAFAIVLSKYLTAAQAEELTATIEDHGGRIIEFGKEDIDVEDISHIISETSDFPEYGEARLHMIPVVRQAWVTQSLQKNKEALIRPYSPDPNLIFSSVHLSCADIPTGDKDAIIGAVLAMGGMDGSTLTRQTTHICALTMDHPKCQSVKEKNLKTLIVLPHWFDDCLKLGKRIDEKPYLLPDPEILRLQPEDPVPMPSNEGVLGASSPRPNNLPVPTDSPTRKLTVFKGKKVMISEDNEIGSRLLKVLEDLVRGGGGEITNSVYNADMYVCHWRDGRDYTIASCAGIDVGNLSWLYYMIANNEWTSPLRRLLHYPLPKNGLPGFDKMHITLSNYGGEARTYLENLVIAAGAEFTKSMKMDNTHLITARKSSEKCAAAQEWGVEMVNHLWIEESYAKCEVQRLTDPRYTHFPPRTNLGEIIGRTQFDREILAKLYFPREPTPSPGHPKPLKRPVMLEKDKNVSPMKRATADDEGEDEDADMVDAEDTPAPVKKPRAKAKPKSSLAKVTTPAPKRHSDLGKENDTPSSTRSAKSSAKSRLSVQASDMNLYEKEKKRKGPVWGGERAANKIDKEISERASSPLRKEEEADYSEEDSKGSMRGRKRQKTGAPPPVTIRMMLTGFKSWLGNPNKEDADKRKLRELGILIVQDPKTCTHLAAPNIVRTQKFLCCLAAGPDIVSSEFIETCLSTGEIPDVKDFVLNDPASEKRLGMKLKDMVARAKGNKRHLLRSVPIYCTEGITNGPAIYKAIAEANGAIFAPYTGRPVIKRTAPEEDDGPAEPVYLLTGNSPKEKALWPKFEKMAKDGNMIPRIVAAEWLLDVAMSQEMKWKNAYLAENNGGS